jgi:hypothetical protein
MGMNVPSEFLTFIEEANEQTCGSVAVALIKWAAANPKEATRIAEEYHKLGRNAKSHFRHEIFWNSFHDPVDAMRRAWDIQAEQHEKRRQLSKALADIRGEGCVVTMPNGISCKITKAGNEYASELVVANVKVTVITKGVGIAKYLEKLREGKFYAPCLKKVILDNQTFNAYGRQGEAILDAVEKNLNPYIHAVIDTPTTK